MATISVGRIESWQAFIAKAVLRALPPRPVEIRAARHSDRYVYGAADVPRMGGRDAVNAAISGAIGALRRQLPAEPFVYVHDPLGPGDAYDYLKVRNNDAAVMVVRPDTLLFPDRLTVILTLGDSTPEQWAAWWAKHGTRLI